MSAPLAFADTGRPLGYYPAARREVPAACADDVVQATKMVMDDVAQFVHWLPAHASAVESERVTRIPALIPQRIGSASNEVLLHLLMNDDSEPVVKAARDELVRRYLSYYGREVARIAGNLAQDRAAEAVQS